VTTNHRFFHVDQFFVMRDVAMSFDCKGKPVRRFVPPFLERALRLEPVKRAVHLDGGETFCIKPKPLFLGRIAIEIRAPAFVIPTAGPDICFAWHHLQ
jgi:hypothetical protein